MPEIHKRERVEPPPATKTKKHRTMEQPTEYRKCRSCGRVLPIDRFRVSERCRGGREPRCMECKSTRKAYTRSAADISLASLPNEILDSLPYEILVEQLRKRGFVGELRQTRTVTI